ncbi:hypothetical protein [Cardinium endosymbiont of Sogatella furcifera]|uniref:hypothetical protein n=1 Tax=Cardinium endosymbiont of Sogatella furcifera TaxID=650378 RepID=UPI000E0CF6C8|nr:hypothetical protein [Cardinium endosymbiont of Sogatella furcifera]
MTPLPDGVTSHTMHTSDLEPEGITPVPDVIANHTMHHTPDPKRDEVAPAPDSVSSHIHSDEHGQVAQSVQQTAIETIFGKVYHIASETLNPVIKATKIFIALMSLIKSEEELQAFEKELNEQLEEIVKSSPGFLMLKRKLEKELDNKYEQILKEGRYLLLGLKYFIAYNRKMEPKKAEVTRQAIKDIVDIIKEAKAVDHTIPTDEAIAGTLSILKKERDRITNCETDVKRLLKKTPNIANMFLDKARKSATTAIETCECVITHVSGLSRIKQVIEGREVTALLVLTVVHKTGKKLLECIENEIEKINAEIDTEMKILANIKTELDKLENYLTPLLTSQK